MRPSQPLLAPRLATIREAARGVDEGTWVSGAEGSTRCPRGLGAVRRHRKPRARAPRPHGRAPARNAQPRAREAAKALRHGADIRWLAEAAASPATGQERRDGAGAKRSHGASSAAAPGGSLGSASRPRKECRREGQAPSTPRRDCPRRPRTATIARPPADRHRTQRPGPCGSDRRHARFLVRPARPSDEAMWDTPFEGGSSRGAGTRARKGPAP